jgi:RNA binding exosome subunit
MEFSSVTISLFIHSTEDPERLLQQIKTRFGLDDVEVSKEFITGHFGNEIISVKAHIIGKRALQVADKIVESLSGSSRLSVVEQIDRSIDEHDALYLRIDRQTLDDGLLGLSDEEPIRIKLKPKTRSGGRQAMISEYRELLK